MNKLNIMCEVGQSANYHIMKMYVDSFIVCGYNVFFHDINTRSTFDAFSEFENQVGKLDIYFGTSWQLSNAVVRNLIARPYVKVILRADHYGELDDIIDRQKYPIGISDINQKRFVEQLRKNHPNFSIMTSQYSQKEMEKSRTHSKWADLGIEMVGIPLAANLNDYYYTEPTKENECQVCFCGNFWDYKSKYLSWIHFLTYPNITLKTKIFGSGWAGISCVGHADENTIRNHYASAIICPCVYEPHSIEVYSDISLRPWQISACHGFTLSHNCIGLREIFTEDEMVTFTDKKDFIEKTLYFISKPEERKNYMDKACLRVYKEHTGFHRSAKILELLDFQEEAKSCLNIAQQKYEEIKNVIG